MSHSMTNEKTVSRFSSTSLAISLAPVIILYPLSLFLSHSLILSPFFLFSSFFVFFSFFFLVVRLLLVSFPMYLCFLILLPRFLSFVLVLFSVVRREENEQRIYERECRCRWWIRSSERRVFRQKRRRR